MTQCRILFFGAWVSPVVLPEILCQQYVPKHQEKPFSNDYTRAFWGCFSLTHFGKKIQTNILRPDITDEFTEVHKVKKMRRQPSGPLVLARFGSAVQKHKNALYPLIKHFCSQSRDFKPAKSNFIKTLTEEKSCFTLTVLAAHRTYLILFFFHLSPLCSNICTK